MVQHETQDSWHAWILGISRCTSLFETCVFLSFVRCSRVHAKKWRDLFIAIWSRTNSGRLRQCGQLGSVFLVRVGCNYWLPGMDPKQSYLWMRRLFFCIIVCQIFIVTWVHSWFIFCRLIENSMIKIRISHVDQFTNTLIAIRSIVSDFQWFRFFLALSRSNISQTFSFCKYLPWPGA